MPKSLQPKSAGWVYTLPCILIHIPSITRHLQCTFTAVIVSIIAVIALVGHGIEAIGCANAALARQSKRASSSLALGSYVLRPAEEAPGLKLATRVVSSARSSGTCTIAVCSTSVAGRSHPLRQENKGVKPHGFRAVYPFGFMCLISQISILLFPCKYRCHFRVPVYQRSLFI